MFRLFRSGTCAPRRDGGQVRFLNEFRFRASFQSAYPVVINQKYLRKSIPS